MTDPFAGDFSQDRVGEAGQQFATLQWNGGARGDDAAWFIDDDNLALLGLAPNEDLPEGFYRAKPWLGGKAVPGWGADEIDVAVLFTDFHWEDRETGKQRFPPAEYDRRKKEGGDLHALRGRTICYVVVRQLGEFGVSEPVRLSVRGSFSANLNGALKDLRRMAQEATKLRRATGATGQIPPEAFWLRLSKGAAKKVGDGGQSSTVHPIVSSIPDVLDRAFLVDSLVDERLRKAGGIFDQLVAEYGEAWKAQTTTGGDLLDEEANEYGGVADGLSRDAQSQFRALMARFIEEIVGDYPEGDKAPYQRANNGALKRLLNESMEAYGLAEDEARSALRQMIEIGGMSYPPTVCQAEALMRFASEPDAVAFVSMLRV